METVEQAVSQAHRSRRPPVIVGGVLLLDVSYTLTKTVVVATALIWGQPLRSVHRPVCAVAVMLGVIVGSVAMAGGAAVLRSISPGWGLVATRCHRRAVGGAVVAGVLPAAPRSRPAVVGPAPGRGPPRGGVAGPAPGHRSPTSLKKLNSASEPLRLTRHGRHPPAWAYVVARLVLAAASVNAAVQRTYGTPSDSTCDVLKRDVGRRRRALGVRRASASLRTPPG